MPLVFVIAALAVVLLVALLAVGRMGAMPQARPDVAPPNLPADREVSAADVSGVRFAVGLRGYRMDQVDIVLERLAVDVHEKDVRIALLQRQLGSGPPPSRDADLVADRAEPAPVEPAASFPPTSDDESGPVR